MKIPTKSILKQGVTMGLLLASLSLLMMCAGKAPNGEPDTTGTTGINTSSVVQSCTQADFVTKLTVTPPTIEGCSVASVKLARTDYLAALLTNPSITLKTVVDVGLPI